MFRTLTPVLSILAGLAIFFLFIKPHYAEVMSVQQDVNAYRQATQDYSAFQQKVNVLESKYQGVSVVERDRLDSFVPQKLDTTQAFVDLEALAKQNGMLFGNIQVISDTSANRNKDAVEYDGDGNPIDPTTQPEHADLGFSVIGTYDQFKALLGNLEKSLTLYEVTHIETEANKGQFMQFNVAVRMYSLPSVTTP